MADLPNQYGLGNDFLPDPAAIARAHADLGEELGKLRNLPAIDQGMAFLEAVNLQFANMEQRMERMEQRMDERFDRVEVKLDRLDNHNFNSVARTQNSLLTTDRDDLFPLVNVTTKQPIEYFPATPSDIDRMNGTQLRSVLAELGAPVNNSPTNVETVKRSLRVQVGLKARRLGEPPQAAVHI